MRTWKKCLAIFLAVFLLLGMLPLSVLAEDAETIEIAEDGEAAEITETIETADEADEVTGDTEPTEVTEDDDPDDVTGDDNDNLVDPSDEETSDESEEDEYDDKSAVEEIAPIVARTFVALDDENDDTVTVTIGNNSYGDCAWTGNLIDGVKVPVKPGDTMLSVIARALTAAVNGTEDIPNDMTGGFISSINGLENDANFLYGWMGAINGVFPSVGFGSVYVKVGDAINVQYLDYWVDNSAIGIWGSLNPATDGFAFSAGRLSSASDGWDGFVLTLTIPQGTTKVLVTEVPNEGNAEVEIFLNDDPYIYELSEDITIADGDVLRIFVGGSETIYEINVRVLETGSIDVLLENMSKRLASSSDGWEIVGMSAYRLYNPATGNTTREAEKQSYINLAMSDIGKANATVANYAKAIIALQSLGVDSGTMYPANSNTPMNLFEELGSLIDASADVSIPPESAPAVLDAFRQDTAIDFSEQIEKVVEFLLSAQLADGSWASSSVAIIGADVDTPAMIIAALAPYYGSDVRVKAAIDKAFAWIKTKQDPTTGAFGTPWPGSTEPSYNESSTAMVIIAMCAMGYDPDGTDIFEYSALDGLLSFLNEDMDNFGSWGDYGAQGFRALVATAQLYKTGEAVNVYDFSGNETKSGRATGEGTVEPPSEPTSDEDIVVAFTLKGLGGETWLSRRFVIVPSDASVYYIFTKVLDGISGLTYDYANNGYIRSITYRSFGKLEEFEHGQNSGWVYSINGELPTIGMTSKLLSDGDNVVWYYTGDYTKEPGSSAFVGEPSQAPAVVNTVEEGDTVVEVKAAVDDNGKTTVEISAAEITDALQNAVKAIEKEVADGKTDVVGEVKIVIETDATDVVVTSEEINITAELITAIAEAGDIALTIESAMTTITLDTDTLTGLVAEIDADKDAVVKITAEIVDAAKGLNAKQREIVGENLVFDLNIFIGDKHITEFDGTITISMPFTPPATMRAEDYDLLTIYNLDAEGNIKEMKGASFDPKTGIITFSTNHFSMFFVNEWISPFEDAARDDWFFRAARYAYGNGLIKGTTLTTFAPNTTISHAMLVTILAREEKVATDGGETWYAPEMDWGIDAGITDGANPDEGVAREQFAVILYRYAEYKGLDVTADANLSTYFDADEVSEEAADAMIWAVANGIIEGRTLTTLAPADTMTRAEAATMLQRFIEEFVRG